MTIKSLRILPPLAIGRLGSADEPMANYTIDLDPDQPLGYRAIVPRRTLVVDERSGKIKEISASPAPIFKKDGKIWPVAPFLEVFAVTERDELEPLTARLLQRHGLRVEDISWRVRVANRKVVRRTNDPADLVEAKVKIENHAIHTLKGHCANFVTENAFVDFGRVRFIKPNKKFPEIRLRFTPAKGLIYGPARKKRHSKKEQVSSSYEVPIERAIYDPRNGGWKDFDASQFVERNEFYNETLPPSLFAINPPAPSWLYDNKAVSRGYLDDACDGLVEVRLRLKHGTELKATARICAAPPALAPDSLFVRSLADDLEQVVHGPDVSPDEPAAETRARAQDIVRRAFETVRFMNVAVMNGNDFKGRSALLLDSMPEEEAADTQRAIRPVMAPGAVDTFAIMTLHQQAFAAMQGGAAPWFLPLLRRPDEVADFTDRGRRKMPALMCGADNSYLALTRRQLDTIRKAALDALTTASKHSRAASDRPLLSPRNLSAQINYEARGNPINSRPVTSVANCCPGLELDFRAVWRRMFRGSCCANTTTWWWRSTGTANTVVPVGPNNALKPSDLKGRRLLRVVLPGNNGEADIIVPVMTEMRGPASSDPDGYIVLTTDKNPAGLAPMEWSNALARVVQRGNGRVICDFSAEASEDKQQPWSDDPKNHVSFEFKVRPFFEPDSAVIARALADAGELTQGLCSPWQNDYRECSCYYWASARPDFVNVETAAGRVEQRRQLDAKKTHRLLRRRRLRRHPSDHV